MTPSDVEARYTLHHASWIDCDVSFVDVPNDAFFIDQEGGTISKALLLTVR